jgi:thiamine biosynthesis lipoprotein
MMSHGSLENIMGTRFDIVTVGKARLLSESVWNKVVAELKRLDNMLNRFDAESEISKINTAAYQQAIKLSSELYDIINECNQYHELTDGLFDITRNNFTGVELNKAEGTISYLTPDLNLDLGAYAKGYALRKVNAILKDAEVDQAFVDFGNSSILAIGHHPYGDSWKVSIENPYRTGEILDEIELKDTSLSTSGNVPSHSNHIVRPDSGMYNDECKLVCVSTDDPVAAEVLSTTLMIATAEEKVKILERFEVKDVRIFQSLDMPLNQTKNKSSVYGNH